MELSAAKISTCSTCGTVLEETSSGDLGCMVCLLRVGLSGEDHVAEEQLAPADGRFGIYVIECRDDGSLHELGRGAMGVTFCALDTSLQRKVALKIIKTDIAAGTEARARFMRGARAAATLRHPNVATIYHFGIREETGQCFYAMELVEGETVEERVRRSGPLDARTTISIAQQVTAALAEAEKRGLVHRDLKPSNLMLLAPDEGGTAAATHDHEFERLKVKVIDFGLAKAIKHEVDPMSLTRGGFVGTPSFASPEQFGNASLDVRSDIYSLGVTLWFALTGKTPFNGRTVEEIRRAQQSDALPVDQLKAARVSSRFVSLLESMLALEPAARPGTTDLAFRLERCQAQTGALAKRRRVMLAAALVLLLAIGAFVALRSRSEDRHRRSANAVGTSNVEAHAAYRKGRSLWNKRDYETLKQAVPYFERAIALDPNYAQAYAGLADTYPLIADNDRLIARSEDYSKAKEAAKKVIELDSTLAEPHAALGLIAMNYDWDWATAEKEYKRAIELNPNYPTAHHWYAEYLNVQGRFDESLAEIRRAHELDPQSQIINSDTGKILYFARRYDEAADVFRKCLETDPTFLQAHHWLGQIYHEKALYDDAIAEFKGGDKPEPSPWTISMIGRTLAKAGKKAEAQKTLQALQEIRKRRELEPQNFIPIYIGLGEKDEVFALLEKEYEVRSTGLTGLKVNPFYDSLRSDPRFTSLLRRVHLAATDITLPRLTAPQKSIAVLPFANLSRDPDNAYFAEGIEDQILTRLVKIADLKVIARSSTQRYVGVQQNFPDIARQLGVANVLQGTVKKERDLVRVTVQLINVQSNVNVWAETYDRTVLDLFQVESDVAQRVATALEAKLTKHERTAINAIATSNVEAYQAYLKGRFFWNKRTPEGYDKAKEYFSQAIALDPIYAQAYAGLGDAYQFIGADNQLVSRAEAFAKSEAATKRALELDPTLAEAHASLGLVAMNWQWDWAGAEREFKRAIELDPNYATAHHWYAEYLVALGRFDESFLEIKRARELDPLSLIINSDAGKILIFSRRPDEAIEHLTEMLKIDPNFGAVHFWLGWVYAEEKRYDEAIAQFKEVQRLAGNGRTGEIGALAGFGYVYGMAGRKKEAEKMLEAARQLAPNRPVEFQSLAIYIGLGDKDRAFACLQAECDAHSTGMTSLKVNPLYDPLRSDLRFADLMRRVHLSL
jgi:serine/threonine protein kinase/TolB-like protein/lipoprotein NlpI